MNKEIKEYDEAGLLPFTTISKAIKGDPESMMTIICHYKKYITMQSRRYYTKPNGDSMYLVDNDICDDLYIWLIKTVLKFRIYK